MTATLIPELYVSDLPASLEFYCAVLGFEQEYARPEQRFAFLRRGRAALMLEQPTDPARTWLAGALEKPYGRGVNFQIEVSNIDALHGAVQESGATILVPLEERWYQVRQHQVGNRQFVVQDPDGYLLRFFQSLGVRQQAGG